MPDPETTDTQPRYRLVTTATQLRPPKPRRKELVILDEVEVDTDDGPVPAAFLVHQVTALEVDEHQDTLRRYDAQGNWVGDDPHHQNLKLLWIAIRDNHGNRLWKTWKDAVAQLGEYPQSAITKLMQGYVKASGGKTEAAVEGNSDGTPTGSSPPE